MTLAYLGLVTLEISSFLIVGKVIKFVFDAKWTQYAYLRIKT